MKPDGGVTPAELSPEVRRYVAVVQAARVRPPAGRLLVIATLLLLGGTLVAAALPAWARAAVCVCLGFLLCTLDVVQHEATHRNLARSAWVNRAAGVLVTAVLARNFSLYRAFHFAHHAHTCTDEDPEGSHVVVSKLSMLGIPLRTVGFWGRQLRDLGRVVVGREVPYVRTRGQVSAVRADAVAMAVLYAAFGTLAAARPVLWLCWTGPLSAYVLLGFPLQHLHEHYGVDMEVGPGRRSRPQSAITRTLRMPKALSWLMGYSNLHKVHHMFPAVPSAALPGLHRVVREHDPWVDLDEPGPLAFVVSSWRSLPLTSGRPA